MPLELSEKYFGGFKNKEEIISVIEMAKLDFTPHQSQKSGTLETEIPSVPHTTSHSNIFYLALSNYVRMEHDYQKLAQRLTENLSAINKQLSQASKKALIESILDKYLERTENKEQYPDDVQSLLTFVEKFGDFEFSNSRQVRQLNHSRVRYTNRLMQNAVAEGQHDIIINFVKSASALDKFDRNINQFKKSVLDELQLKKVQDRSLLLSLMRLSLHEDPSILGQVDFASLAIEGIQKASTRKQRLDLTKLALGLSPKNAELLKLTKPQKDL